MSLYVYCVTTGDAPPLNITGLLNQPASVARIGQFGIIVSDFSGGELKATKENIFAHERVVVGAMEHVTPLPFRFGTVVSEDRLKTFVETNAEALRMNLENVRDCVEMGLKVLTPAQSAGEQPEPTSGTEFLRQRMKKQALQKTIAGWIDSRLTGKFRQSDSSVIPGTARTMIRIAHLVPKCHLSDYKTLVDLLVQERTDLAFLRSGPWPPYSFIATPRLC